MAQLGVKQGLFKLNPEPLSGVVVPKPSRAVIRPRGDRFPPFLPELLAHLGHARVRLLSGEDRVDARILLRREVTHFLGLHPETVKDEAQAPSCR